MLHNKSSRRLSQVFNIVLFAISVAFAVFLLQAGSLIIKNLPDAVIDTSLEDHLDQQKITTIDEAVFQLEKDADLLNIEKNALLASQRAVEKRYQLEKEKYNTELSSRFVTEEQKKNADVDEALQLLALQRDKLKNIKAQISTQEMLIAQKNKAISTYRIERETLYREANKQIEAAADLNTLKAFSIRLLFVLPLLVISAVLFSRFRHSNYWPFVYGWGYFSLYAFFIELVPYFPSYGGYARAIVGIIFCVLIGKFTIEKLNQYLLQKRQLEAEDEGQRREKLQREEAHLELAFQKIAKQICPSCDRQFVENSTKYCSFCGLCILKKCPSCNRLQISFNQFCQECGAKQN